MDSMRSLNRSLPTTGNAPPEQLLQAFKQAALAVTTLYKSASSDHDSIRQAGYQEAIDDLLKFLDRENLGVQDGEGWRVRQWATERYDGTFHASEEEKEEQDEPQETQTTRAPSEQPVEQTRSKSEPARDISEQDRLPVFQFSAGDRMQTEDAQSTSNEDSPIRIEVVNRANRPGHRHHTRQTRTATRLDGQSTGSKRKLPFPDLSEIFNVNFDKKDGSDGGSGGGGNKRSRLV